MNDLYYDLIFPFKIKEGCLMGIQGDGEQLPIYTKLTLGKAKNAIDGQGYNEMHERLRQQMADMIHEDIEMVVCISGEEYEANVDEDESEEEK